MSIPERRARAIEATLDKVRAIEARAGATRAALDEIKAVLTDLAGQAELFPPAQFATPAGAAGVIYRLSEDADLRFALYASAGVPGKAQPPHNHTTWAAIAGVYGAEHNVFYERVDDRRAAGPGRLRKTGETTVRRGDAIALQPDDFHTIAVTDGGPSLHLHLYGRSLEHLPGRIFFSGPEGGRHATFPANPNIRTVPTAPAELKAMLRDGEELAILDVREEGVFARGHLLFAVCLPLSHLELRLARLVPRPSTRIVLCDGGDGLAERAALTLMHLGYRNATALAGGVAAWAAAGYELFSGINVPSKAFGEFVELRAGTPHLSAAELKARQDRGDDMVILDSRPLEEFRRMSIPGGLDCPGAELVRRVHDAAPRPETLVVVNCAGRTRSIVGAQSLIDAGVPNRVMALENGTMGWHLAGLELARGQERSAGPPSAGGLARARAAAARVGARAGARVIDRATLAAYRREAGHRSLYLLDVRGPDEYAAGHLPGARSAPGGQLVQATDHYVATRNARLVLCDDDGVRATMTASWLIQMGWPDVSVVAIGPAGDASERGPEPATALGLDRLAAIGLSPAALRELLQGGAATVVDLDTSLHHREGHIPGAWWAVRARLAAEFPSLPAGQALVFTSPDGLQARYAAAEVAAWSTVPVRALEGGTAAWRAAGYPIEPGLERPAHAVDDVWYRPYDRAAGAEAAMRDYLTWEVDLLAQVERDGDARFTRLPSGP